MQRVPARIGDPLAAVETPALVVDLDAFEYNLDLMANAVRGSGLALRPHAKAHKCPDIAKAQIARGAVGICCQKVDEAAVFVAAGIANVLVTNEVVMPAKIARLAALAQSATIGVLVDNASVIADLSAAAAMAGGTLARLCGDRRRRASLRRRAGRGRQYHSPARLRPRPGSRFADCMRITARAQHLRTPAERSAAIAAASAFAAQTKALIEKAGVRCPVVTGAGTGTWQLERDSGVYTELQPGSYIFMDADYGRNALAPDGHAFEHSLYVLATVMSTPAPERAIVDAGLKALAFDSGMPIVHVARGLDYVKASDEHGVLAVDPPPPRPRSATACGSSPDIAIRPSISTTGSSACAASAWSASGPWRRGVRWVECQS